MQRFSKSGKSKRQENANEIMDQTLSSTKSEGVKEKDYVDLRLIDFANFEYDMNSDKPDIDLIQGVSNLIMSLEQLVEKPPSTVILI